MNNLLKIVRAIVVVVACAVLSIEPLGERTEQVESAQVESESISNVENESESTEVKVEKEPMQVEYQAIEVTKTYVPMYATDTVNLRSAESTDSEVLTIIPRDTVVDAYLTDSDWVEVKYNEKIGYVYCDYLRMFSSEDYYDIDLGYSYQDLIDEMIFVMDLNIDKEFILGLMWVENRFSTTTESYAGAKGIMQIMPSTFDTEYKGFITDYPEYSDYVCNNIDDVQSNIIIGIYTIKQIAISCGDPNLNEMYSMVLTSYNRGLGGAHAYYSRTGSYSSDYSRSVLDAAEYLREHGSF